MELDDEVALWPAVRQRDAIARGELSSSALLELQLERIERLDGPLNAVVTLDAERARAAAARADELTARGESPGPLHGLPVTIKDALETEGIRSTGGAQELASYVPGSDAPAVARLKAAGAIVFGKTNLPRWSMDLQCSNEVFGTTSNPWSLDCTPGGSSGGACAAVACGFTSFEVGTDLAGSVRMPAHFCGVFGLKPSDGVIPTTGYLDHPAPGVTEGDMNTFGPIARSVEDLELLLDVLAGPGDADAVAWSLDLPRPSAESLDGFRLAAWLDDSGLPVDAECLGLLRAAVAKVAGAGAEIEEARPDVDFASQFELYAPMLRATLSPAYPADEAEEVSGSHLAWLRREEERAYLRAKWAAWFRDYDALLCPVLPMPAFAHDHAGKIATRTVTINGAEVTHFDSMAWASMINLLGLPAVAVPIGCNSAGLPFSLQVVAPFLHERRALRIAKLVSEAVGGYSVPPAFRA